jgi:hypothetical protein
MKRTILALLVVLAAFGVQSCNKEPQPMSRQQIRYQIDSITRERIKESDAMARQDLDRRMKIEVKVKVDSMVNAICDPKPKDTTVAKPELRRPDMFRHGLKR